MGRTDVVAPDPSVADRTLSHKVRKCRRATSPASPGRNSNYFHTKKYKGYAASVSCAVRMKCRFFSMPAVAPQM